MNSDRKGRSNSMLLCVRLLLLMIVLLVGAYCAPAVPCGGRTSTLCEMLGASLVQDVAFDDGVSVFYRR
uniref:NTR domain-containing protein n=1 Tax=Ascaris lumbricoides TaxID=6252 RepID=A0A0M3HVP8_ASCLU